MAKDYSYLEGKKFTYFNGDIEIPAKVLYADYHIGLTCIAEDNPDFYLICVRGPMAPRPSMETLKGHQYLWLSTIQRIMRGYISVLDMKPIYRKHSKRSLLIPKTGSVHSSNCAFGQ